MHRFLLPALFLLWATATAQPCNTTQELKEWQIAELTALTARLNTALANMDLEECRRVQLEVRLVLGTEAGHPAFVEKYDKLSSRSRWFTQDQCLKQAEKVLTKYPDIYNNLETLAQGLLPGTTGKPNLSLAAAGEMALGLLILANQEPDEEKKVRYLDMGLKTLDRLQKMQQGSGAFPFLDTRGQRVSVPPLLLPYYARIPNDTIELPNKGWLTYDFGSGRSLFTNGRLCAVYARAYHETNFEAYKEVATNVATHLLTEKPVAYARYNADLVYGLVHAHHLLSDPDYLQRAVEVAQVALLPAQLDNGRWPDSLDAQAYDHARIVEGLTALVKALPETNDDRKPLLGSLLLATRNLVRQYSSCGSPTSMRWALEVYTTPGLPGSLKDSLTTLIGRLSQTQALHLDELPSLAIYARLMRTETIAQVSASGNMASLSQFPITPNPFTDYTLVSFELTEKTHVLLKVMDAKGKVLATLTDEVKESGVHHIRWDSKGQPAGSYLFQLTIKGRAYLRKAELKR